MDITRFRTVIALRWLYGWRTAVGFKFYKRFQTTVYSFNDWRSAMDQQSRFNWSSAKLIEDDPLVAIANLDLSRWNRTSRACVTASCVGGIFALAGGGLLTCAAGGWLTGGCLLVGTVITFMAFLFQWTAGWTQLHNVPTLEAVPTKAVNTVMQLPQVNNQPVKASVYLSRKENGETWLNIISPSGLYANLLIRDRPSSSIIQRVINETVEATK